MATITTMVTPSSEVQATATEHGTGTGTSSVDQNHASRRGTSSRHEFTLFSCLSWYWKGCRCLFCGAFGESMASSSVMIILFGQFMSFTVAAGFAALATLRLDCHLSAPTLSITPLYLALSCFHIPLHFARRAEQDKWAGEHKKTDTQTNNHPPSLPDMGENEQASNGETVASTLIDGTNAAPVQPKHSFLYLIPLSQPFYMYAILAVADMYAQIFMIWAFRYTTITSVAVMDALAIPSAMVLSRFWLGRRYGLLHFVGVIACMTGILLNVFQDYEEDQAAQAEAIASGNPQDSYPQKALGDALGFFGGILFGISNTIAEHLVRDVKSTGSSEISRFEYLAMMGTIASSICVIQTVLLERNEIQQFVLTVNNDDMCSHRDVILLWMFFAVCCVIGYVGTARFLQVSEAVFYNLSLLTGDFWCVGFQVFEEHIKPMPLFYPSLLLIISGTIVYEMTSSPVAHTGHVMRRGAEKGSEGECADDEKPSDNKGDSPTWV